MHSFLTVGDREARAWDAAARRHGPGGGGAHPQRHRARLHPRRGLALGRAAGGGQRGATAPHRTPAHRGPRLRGAGRRRAARALQHLDPGRPCARHDARRYDRDHEAAMSDPQAAGHEGRASTARRGDRGRPRRRPGRRRRDRDRPRASRTPAARAKLLVRADGSTLGALGPPAIDTAAAEAGRAALSARPRIEAQTVYVRADGDLVRAPLAGAPPRRRPGHARSLRGARPPADRRRRARRPRARHHRLDARLPGDGRRRPRGVREPRALPDGPAR